MGFDHPLDGNTNLKYKLLCFLTPNKKNSKRKALAFNQDRCCHLALCLRLILFHYLALRVNDRNIKCLVEWANVIRAKAAKPKIYLFFANNIYFRPSLIATPIKNISKNFFPLPLF
jgi:hypothetical protein